MQRQTHTLQDASKPGEPRPMSTEAACQLHERTLALRESGQLAEVATLAQRALQYCAGASGPDHLDMANLLTALARIRTDQDDYAEVARLARRAVAILEQATRKAASAGIPGFYLVATTSPVLPTEEQPTEPFFSIPTDQMEAQFDAGASMLSAHLSGTRLAHLSAALKAQLHRVGDVDARAVLSP